MANCKIEGVASTCRRGPPGITLPLGFCSQYFATTTQSVEPRGIVKTGGGDILALDRGRSPAAVISLHDDDNNGVAESVTIVAEMNGLNHGVAVHNAYVYASSDTTVWRWAYSQNQRVKSTAYQVVVRNINANGQGGAPRGHWTRTLIFDEHDYLYVSVGSVGNVDVDDFRSRIRRFKIPANGTLPSGGFDFQQGEIFATGLRNEVGLAFDRNKVLYGVENGADNLVRDDLGGDIHNDNPGEELNRFPIENLGKHYGYPFCWTEYKLPKSISPGGKGTIWAWPSTKAVKNDQWCRDNTVKPMLSMQAHSAPLGITFFNYTYVGNDTEDCPSGGGFPQYMDGDAFIAFHGSWNRNPPTGYKVVRVPMNRNGSPKVDDPIDFLCHGKGGAKFPNGFRPVDVVFDKCNRLLVTSDGTSGSGTGVVVVQYNGEEDCAGCAPSPAGSSPSPTGGCTECREDQGQDPFMTILIILAVSAFTLIFLWSAWILYKKVRRGASIVDRKKNEDEAHTDEIKISAR